MVTMSMLYPYGRNKQFWDSKNHAVASSHTSLTLFLVIFIWRSRISFAPTWITILLNLCLALASTFKFAKMSGALAPGKHWTMVAGVSLGTDALACSWPRGLRKYAFPPVSLLAQTLCKVREDEEQVLLVAPYWPNLTFFPELMLLVTAPPWQIPLRRDLLSQRGGTLWRPRPDLWNLHVWSLDGTRRF